MMSQRGDGEGHNEGNYGQMISIEVPRQHVGRFHPRGNPQTEKISDLYVKVDLLHNPHVENIRRETDGGDRCPDRQGQKPSEERQMTRVIVWDKSAEN